MTAYSAMSWPFSSVNQAISVELGSRTAVFDGEIVGLDADGKPQFRDLLFRRGEPRFVAFDLLWLDGIDLRYLSFSEQQEQPLREIPALPRSFRNRESKNLAIGS